MALYGSSSKSRSPAVLLTGREKIMDFALLTIPAFSITAFMIPDRWPVLDTMKIISFSDARDTPKKLSARSMPVPLRFWPHP